MSEQQLFPVPAEAAKRALIDAKKYEEMYRRSVADPEGFWGEHRQARRLDQALQQGEGRRLHRRRPHPLVL